MGFLTPFFLAGLAGLAIPVLIHLTRQEKGRPLRFPSLMLLRRIPFEETSKRRIRHRLLLAVRLAALALLAAAFARPFARGGALASVGGGGPEEVVILLDRSYSMELGDHWRQALARAGEVAEALRPQDRVSLAAFSETPHLLIRSTTDPTRITAALDTLRTSSLATRIGPALKLARSTLAASGLPRRRVVVISDFQRAGWRPDPDATLPAGVSVEAAAIGEGGAANLALTDPELRRESAGARERVTVSARIVNTGDAETAAEAALAIDETVVGTAPVTVPAGGAVPVSFDPFTLTHPFTRGEVRVEEPPGTGLQSDNTLHFVVSPGGDLRLLVVDPLGEGDSNLHLRGALGVAGGAGFGTVLVRGAPGENRLAAADVVVLNGAPFPGGSAGDRLRAFVEDGGGLLFVLGERSTVPSAHADFLPAAVGPVNEAAGERRIGFVDYDHSVFEAFLGPRSGDFSRAAVHRTRRLDLTDGRVVARFDDGSPALVEGRRGKGRVLIWATGLDRLWNNLPLQPVYLPFVHRMARFLAGRGEIPSWHPAGSTVDLSALAEAGADLTIPPGAVAMGPGGGSVPVDPETSLLRLAGGGIWEIRPPGERPEHPVAVAANVDVAESDMTRMDIEEFLGAVGGEPASGEARSDSASADDATVELRAADLEGRQSFWRYLLAAVFLLMVSETALANRLSRQRTGGPSQRRRPRPRSATT